ncbi:uncharacterized protein PITG_01463 [Phytophthora infestans T30-4]|uniref:Uncharacterized protein n=1 Tax=Phytophthora infestans (strain T30-4) TaxID=403677 RepID=D0MTB5_PHYIT|nr:uncharacterized protein PITG_01463 [Phytophthora infestans T30-4]EEY61212.1 hypothetical protein PITG_01463 [Phytophthora infestans T30-4]|eukprot:XP_002908129.1 hypothetical protein PITG_01463 [Phytophthora infestans T30-4]
MVKRNAGLCLRSLKMCIGAGPIFFKTRFLTARGNYVNAKGSVKGCKYSKKASSPTWLLLETYLVERLAEAESRRYAVARASVR